LAMIRPGEALYYYHNDHLGTPQILTNDTGAVSWKAVYTPFGEAEISGQTVENNIRFPGQYYDQETGLHYNWNRYYDPKTGRYLTPDPIGLDGGINPFVYVENNPINYGDALGLSSKSECVEKANKWHANCLESYSILNKLCMGECAIIRRLLGWKAAQACYALCAKADAKAKAWCDNNYKTMIKDCEREECKK